MDFSTKNTSMLVAPLLNAKSVSKKSEKEQPDVSSSFADVFKGEYIEEDIPVIKKEKPETQESDQKNKNSHSYFLPFPQPPPLLPLLHPTPVSSLPTPLYPNQLHNHSRFYPPIPPLCYPQHPLPHSLYDLPSFYDSNSTTVSNNKRKPCSSSNLEKRLRNVSPEKSKNLSDTNNEIPQEATLDLTLEPPSHSRTTQSEEQIRLRSERSTIDCPVCEDTAVAHFHYGGMCCYSCKAFFRRVVNTYKVILTSHYPG